MPSSNWYDELIQGIDPIDAATIFAGLRNTIPLGLAFRHGEANAGEAEELAKIYGPANFYVRAPQMPKQAQHKPSQLEYGMIIDEFQRAMPHVQHLPLAKRSQALSEFLRNREVMRELKGYAGGGQVLSDFTSPDMSDGGQFLGDSHLYAGGGGVKKTLDEMQAELMKKGAKLGTKEKVDLGRRSLFGLPKIDDFKIAEIEKQYAQQGQAPTVTKSTTSVSPDAGKTSKTIEKLIETPVSRRSVLKSASGQAMQGILPETGVVGSIAKAMSPIESVVRASAPTPTPTIAGLVTQALKMGLNESDTAKYVMSHFPSSKAVDINDDLYHIDQMIRDPYGTMIAENMEKNPVSSAMRSSEFSGPADLLSNMVGVSRGTEPGLRPTLRSIRQADPDKYQELVNAARDYMQYGFEP